MTLERPLGGDEEIEVVFMSFLYQLAFGVDHQAIKVGRLDYVKVLHPHPSFRAVDRRVL